MRKINLIFVALCVMIMVSCSKDDPWSNSSSSSSSSSSSTEVGEEVTSPTEDDYITSYSFTQTVSIVWSGASATISNGADDVVITSNDAGNVVITSTAGKDVCYQLSGSGTGSLKIYSDHLYKISLNGLTLTSTSGPAFNLQSSKRAFIVMESGTTNTLTDSSNYPTSDEDQKAALFAEGQLVFYGPGSLTVVGNYKHGICSDDYIIGMSGTLNVTGKVKDAVHTNDYFILEDGSWTVAATSEGIEAEAGNICVNGGEIYAKCTDDCINAAGIIKFNGGYTYCWSTGNDGIDSNYSGDGAITINDGVVIALCAIGGVEEGVDTDDSAIVINGGYLFTMGGTMGGAMGAPGIGGGSFPGGTGTIGNSTTVTATQPTALLSSMSLTRGNYLSVFDSDGNTLFTIYIPFTLSANYSLITCPNFAYGSTYTVKTGSSAPTGYSSEWNGFYVGGTSSASTTKKTISFSSYYVSI